MEASYAQHTAETGQAFTPDAVARAIELTGGQPWLVNALGYEIVDRMAVPPTETITLEHIEDAKERLILARATHLVFMAFLRRVVNGGGFIDREYGVGRGRVDLLLRFPYKDAD